MRIFVLLFISISFQWAWGQAEFVDSPQQCFFKKTYPCRIRVSGGFLSFERGVQKFHLGDQSSLLFLSDSEIQVLQGQVWVRDSKDLAVKVTSALSFTASGEFFFQKLANTNLLVRNLQGELKFHSKFVFASEALPVGFQNWYGPLDASGQISRGVIRPIALVEFLKVWAPLSGESIAGIRRATLAYREQWGDTLEKSADLYQEIVERRIASHEEKARRLADKQKSQLNEREKLRQMFREKNGLGADHGL